MTRDEALKKVKGYLTDYLPKDDYDEVEEIVSALKQEPSNDCISRQAVDELCHRYLRQNTDEHIAFYEHFLDLPSIVPQESKWISVGKRLPTKEEYIANNGFFIVSDGNRVYTAHFDIYESMNFGKPTVNGFKVDTCVTAWMPLPNVYEMPLSKLYLPKLHEENERNEDDNREVEE